MRLHPFGDPQTVDISSDGGAVHVHWEVGGTDDLTLLGIHLGVLPEDRVMLDGAITYDDGDGALVSDAPELEPYLLDHVAVSAGGADCTGEVTAVDDLTEGGADLSFTCPQDADSATVTVTMLTDLHPAYRALASGPDGQRTVYSSTQDSHDWQLAVTAGASGTTTAATAATAATPAADTPDDGAGLGASAAVQMGAVGAVLLILAAGAVLLRRRLHRTTTSTPEGASRATSSHHEVP